MTSEQTVSVDEAVAAAQAGNPYLFMENFLWIVNKYNNLVPLKANRVQELKKRMATHQDFTVKMRQGGSSTWDLAEGFTYALCVPYWKSAAVTLSTDDGKTKERLFQTVKRFVDVLNQSPDKELHVAVDYSTKDYLAFHGTESEIYIGTAGSRDFGRSERINYLLFTEKGRWKDKEAHEVSASATQSVPMGGIIRSETTPKRVGSYAHGEWMDARAGRNNYNPIFIPWYVHDEYRLPADHPNARAEDSHTPLELIDEEVKLTNHFLDDGIPAEERIRFRRWKLAELKEDFYADYPEDETSCWLATTNTVFPTALLREMLLGCRKPSYDDGQYMKWQEPNRTRSYVVCGDAADGIEGQDKSAAVALCIQTGEVVAVLHGYMAPNEFTPRCLDMAREWNSAKVGWFNDARGKHCISIAKEMGYEGLFRHKEYGMPPTARHDYGLPESNNAQIMMVNSLRAAMAQGELHCFHAETIQQLMEYTKERTDAGRETFSAPSGRHDDLVDALLGAQAMRLQEPYRPMAVVGEARQRIVSYPAGVL